MEMHTEFAKELSSATELFIALDEDMVESILNFIQLNLKVKTKQNSDKKLAEFLNQLRPVFQGIRVNVMETPPKVILANPAHLYYYNLLKMGSLWHDSLDNIDFIVIEHLSN